MAEKVKTKKVKRGQKFANFLWGVAITMSFQVAIPTIHTGYERNQLFQDVDTSYFKKTVFGVPLILPIKGGQVSVNISPSFTEEQKQAIVKGINEIDDLLDGVNYTISFEDKDVKKAINIKSFKVGEKSEELGIACATKKENQFTAQITYPISIKFDTKMMEEEGYSYNYIIKHELLHTLGLKDLTGSENRKNIMYGTYTTKNPTLNTKQLEALRKIYDPYRTGVFGPTDCGPSVNYFFDAKPTKHSEDDDLLTF